MTNDRSAAERDPSRWVDEHGDALFRFALLRVSDPDLAGDLVQDTFLSALKAIDGFRGGSIVRTWLIGILKHKIIDHYRRNRIEVLASDLPARQRGRRPRPRDRVSARWSEAPSQLVENREFWAHVHELPRRASRRPIGAPFRCANSTGSRAKKFVRCSA